MWVLMTGLLLLDINQPVSYDGQDLYIMNYDLGQGDIQMGELFEELFEQQTLMEEAPLDGVNLVFLDPTVPEENAGIALRDSGDSPCILIPSNFTAMYLDYESGITDVPTVHLLALPGEDDFVRTIRDQILQILYQPPFSIVEFQTQVIIQLDVYSLEGETPSDPVSAWQISFFMVYIGLFAPSPIVSGYFAKEREKRTLEGIMVLPMSDLRILLGKFLSGALLMGIFSLMNIVGMIFYNLTTQNLSIFQYSDLAIFELTIVDGLILCGVLFITAITALGVGISLTSRSDDSRTVETTYSFTIVVPYALIALFFLISGDPPLWIYLIPWAHSGAMINKALFPNTFLTDTITGSWTLDVVFHGFCLVLFNIIALGLAAFLTKRGSIFRLGGT
jgi:hypothetical protein